ncbi:MAG: GNAT family N-acetyltransferase [Gallionella sp.]|nr:GNAT family N-acetyltransferase [Gallionella sp.]
MMQAPQPLAQIHDCSGFDCGEPTLNEWLKRRALANQITGASRTFVLVGEFDRVLGYYALAAGAVAHANATGAVRRNMPDPVPVMVLGRLAVDLSCQGKKLGAALLKDAVLRTVAVSENAGMRALLAHALNEPARQFYIQYGFSVSPVNPLTLMLPLRPAHLARAKPDK